MKILHSLLVVLALALFLPLAHGQAPDAAAAPAIDPAKKAEIQKLLELTGTAKLMQQVLDQMLSGFKAQQTGVPAEFWDRFQKELNVQDLLDKMMPIYDKYYTTDDLKAVNAFYATPVGQRMLASMPLISRDSMQIGQAWGQSVAKKLEAEIQAEKAKGSSASPATSTPAPAPNP